MADLTKHVDVIAASIFEKYEKASANEKPRTYLGASVIGNECARALWYGLRWSAKEEFNGRMLRLFQTGHLAESRFVADLRSIGAVIYDTDPATGRQFGFSDHGGHMRGHMDGCVKNIPGGGLKWHVAEFKTHSAKSFTELKKSGVKKAKPQHFAQMQWYMGKSGMDRALYLAVNKDDDDLYSERIEFDQVFFERIQMKAESIIFGQTPPPRISDDPKFYLCNWCPHNGICHSHQVPAVSCRTCVHSTPERDGDGRWTCAKGETKVDIPVEIQRKGCPGHLPLPFLLTYATPVDAGDGWIRFQRADNGAQFIVADNFCTPPNDVPVYTSREISAAKDHRAIADPEIEQVRQQYQGRIVG